MSKHQPLITDDGTMDHVLRQFEADGLGALEIVTGTHHKFDRVPGECKCTVCGQGEAFAAHRPPNNTLRRTLVDMNRDYKEAKREMAGEERPSPKKKTRTDSG